MTRLPRAPKEVPLDRSTDQLAPAFRAALFKVVALLRDDGHDPTIIETLRTQERQSFLYGFGRLYDDGRGIVTNSQDADESWHFYGLAADIVSRVHLWSAPPAFWAALGKHARAHGLTWGGDWNGNGVRDERFIDVPHVQWGRCRLSPSPRAARLWADGGPLALWAEVGAS